MGMVDAVRLAGGPAWERALNARQRALLRRTLDDARRIEGYRDLLGEAREREDPYAVLRGLPVLEREAVQAHPDAYRDRSVPGLAIPSSGSTGTPLTSYLHPRARWRRRRQWASFFLAHGWRPWHRAVTIKLIDDEGERLGSPALDRTVLRRRVSVSALAPTDDQERVVRSADPEVLHGYPSLIGELAARAEARGWTLPRLRLVFTGSELVSPALRRQIEGTFGVPVIDSYAANEAFIGWQCARRSGYHVQSTSVVVEILDSEAKPTPPGDVGRVVITTLDNPAMPLVRYAIGDMAIAGDGERCACGRPQPTIPRVLGRSVPLMAVAGERRSPWGVLTRMYELDFVRQFRLVQDSPDQVRALIRPRNGAAVDRAAIRTLIVEELGSLHTIEIESVAELDRLPSGKAGAPLVAPTLPAEAEAPLAGVPAG